MFNEKSGLSDVSSCCKKWFNCPCSPNSRNHSCSSDDYKWCWACVTCLLRDCLLSTEGRCNLWLQNPCALIGPLAQSRDQTDQSQAALVNTDKYVAHMNSRICGLSIKILLEWLTRAVHGSHKFLAPAKCYNSISMCKYMQRQPQQMPIIHLTFGKCFTRSVIQQLDCWNECKNQC